MNMIKSLLVVANHMLCVYFCVYIMEEVIQGVHATQFGTAYETYKDVVKIDSSIRLNDINY